MDKVKIYTETSTNGKGKIKLAAGMYTVECLRNDTAVTCQGILIRENVTGDALAIEIILGAFKRLVKPCEVSGFTQSRHVLNVMQNHWLPVWEKAGWVKSKGRSLKNKELWQQVYEEMQNHTVSFDSGENPYQDIMQSDIRKALDVYKKGKEYCPMEIYRKEPVEGGGWWITWR